MRRTRKELLSEAATYLSKSGLRTANMKEIAEALGISRSSLYYHWSDKTELLNELLVGIVDEYESQAREIAGYPLPASQRLALLIRSTLRLQAKHPALPLTSIIRAKPDTLKPHQRSEYIRHRDAYEATYRSVILDGIASGEFRPVNAKIVTLGLMGLLEGFDGWFRPDGPQTADEIASIYADLFLAALCVSAPSSPIADCSATSMIANRADLFRP